jgi:hypothetical protein
LLTYRIFVIIHTLKHRKMSGVFPLFIQMTVDERIRKKVEESSLLIIDSEFINYTVSIIEKGCAL